MLMVATFNIDPAKAKPIIDQLVAAGADPFAKNSAGEDLFAICDIPQNGQYLSERFLYPKAAEQRAITIAFPDSTLLVEVARANDGEETAPPALRN